MVLSSLGCFDCLVLFNCRELTLAFCQRIIEKNCEESVVSEHPILTNPDILLLHNAIYGRVQNFLLKERMTKKWRFQCILFEKSIDPTAVYCE